MKAQDLRNKFTKYFTSVGHQKLSSSSIVPENDPTLLFANAGMNQFKDFFTGRASPQHKRAVTIQKCVRAGGKHNDLDNVGFTARHHTFFEMLGNFSFGDYFKQDAIAMAWEFLTKQAGMPSDKLYVTIHKDDEEALNIWHKKIGLSKDRIFKKGDETNFWEMGEFGPCGPCSEIFFDHGDKYSTKNFKPAPGQDILDDELRYVEIWNLVFMQYEKTPNGISVLPKPSIDTGAGIERSAAILQGKYWNYDTDLFMPIIHKLETISKKSYQDPQYSTNFRVVADHVRACSMMITDGIIPSNEGRGYVLRRIIRRATRHLKDLGIRDASLHKLVDPVFEILGFEYPQNLSNKPLAKKFLETEEVKFLETLEHGLKFLNDAISKENIIDNSGKTLSGDSAFMLYDSFGFPLDLTQIILRDRGINVDFARFEICMEKRREDSRKSWKTGGFVDKSIFFKAHETFGDSKFCGYKTLSLEAKLLAIIPLDDVTGLVFDNTPFYPESGGQLGDTGKIYWSSNEFVEIIDTQKPVAGLIVHFATNASTLEINRKYTLQVDEVTRKLTERNHSATHLLQAALTKVLGSHIKQAGSSVGPDRLRFDFTHTSALSAIELQKVENLVNEQITLGLTVKAQVLSKEEALKQGAVALFGEKYGDQVRVLQMHDFSVELCGGTHIENTSDIGLFSIVSEGALSSGIRRIEAVTSQTAIDRLNKRSRLIDELEQITQSQNENILTRIESYKQDLKDQKKEIQRLNQIITSLKSSQLFDSVDKHGNLFILVKEIPSDIDLKKVSDDFISKYANGLCLIWQQLAERTNLLLRTGPNAKGIHCGNLLKENLAKFDGKGGGRADMAQGSVGPKVLNQLIESLKSSIYSI